MIDGISNTSPTYSPELMQSVAAAPQAAGMEVAASMLGKAMDTQAIALTQLLQQMGVGNNIDSLA